AIVVSAPLVVGRRTGESAAGRDVVTVGVGDARRTACITRGVAVNVPAKSLSRPIKDPVLGLPRRGVGVLFQASAEFGGIGLTQDQVAVARQNTHMVSVLVKGMLPMALPNDTD